jgi:hypothetical protein
MREHGPRFWTETRCLIAARGGAAQNYRQPAQTLARVIHLPRSPFTDMDQFAQNRHLNAGSISWSNGNAPAFRLYAFKKGSFNDERSKETAMFSIMMGIAAWVGVALFMWSVADSLAKIASAMQATTGVEHQNSHSHVSSD